MNIIQKAEALAATVGTDLEHLWQEFEMWVLDRHQKKITLPGNGETSSVSPSPSTVNVGTGASEAAPGTEPAPDAAIAPGSQPS